MLAKQTGEQNIVRLQRAREDADNAVKEFEKNIAIVNLAQARTESDIIRLKDLAEIARDQLVTAHPDADLKALNKYITNAKQVAENEIIRIHQAAEEIVKNTIAEFALAIGDKIELLTKAKNTKEIVVLNSAVTILKDQLPKTLTKPQKQQVDQMLKKWDEKLEEAKERIIATEIFDSIFSDIADNHNIIGDINRILLDLKGNINKVLNGEPIENEEKIRSIVKRLLESKLSILVKTKKAAETAVNDLFTKHQTEFNENKIDIEQEIKKALNIVKKLSDPNVDVEFFTKNYADALKQKLDQARLVARTTELHKGSKETKATATNTKASASSTQPKQPTITVAQEQHKKNTSSLQDEIENIIEAIKRSQTIDNVVEIINTQIKDILTKMSLEEKEKYFTNQISHAITDRSIKFFNDTATPRQVFDLLPKIVEIKNSAILTPDDDVRLMATRDQQIRSKGRKTR